MTESGIPASGSGTPSPGNRGMAESATQAPASGKRTFGGNPTVGIPNAKGVLTKGEISTDTKVPEGIVAPERNITTPEPGLAGPGAGSGPTYYHYDAP